MDLIPRLRPKYQLSSGTKCPGVLLLYLAWLIFFVFINHFWLCAVVQSKWLHPIYYKTLKRTEKFHVLANSENTNGSSSLQNTSNPKLDNIESNFHAIFIEKYSFYNKNIYSHSKNYVAIKLAITLISEFVRSPCHLNFTWRWYEEYVKIIWQLNYDNLNKSTMKIIWRPFKEPWP